MSSINHQFPVDCNVSPTISQSKKITAAYNEVVMATQAPEPMVYLTTLSAVAVAVQGILNAEMPTGKVVPTSIMALSIAGSGERKSSVENKLTKGIKSFYRDSQKRYQKQRKEYEIRSELHERKTAQLKKSINQDDEDQVDEMLVRILQHEERAPKTPKLPLLTFEDSTSEALVSAMNEHTPNGYLGSSEGGVLLNGRVMSRTPALNSIWSGDDVTVNRKSSESFTIIEPRLTMNVMVQPNVVEDYIKKTNGNVRGNGHLSRYLVCAPDSNCGFRYNHGINYSEDNLELFNDRIYELLSQAAELSDYKDKITVSLSDEAKKYWYAIANDIEDKMKPGGIYEYARDHASKLGENIVRLAALIHYFDESSQEKISLDTLVEATELVAYFSDEFMKVFACPPKYKTDAENLFRWFATYADSGVRYIKRNNILQFGPSGTRKKADLDLAFEYLKTGVNVKEIVINRTRIIDLYPDQDMDTDRLRKDLLCEVVL
ncbi:YfjI family protein [Vibrio sp. HN007]|uniref:YfjI family protein n=1 Tax=Vibrio iocasae TaxID=3098914 RepID=UPI0035D49D9C